MFCRGQGCVCAEFLSAQNKVGEKKLTGDCPVTDNENKHGGGSVPPVCYKLDRKLEVRD